jgi:OPT family oligopeptide transporter
MGTFLAEILPTRQFTIYGRRCSFNPGPFNEKEHMLITIMANVSSGSAYATELITVQRLPFFFNQTWANSWGYQICLILSTQLLGYGLAGMARMFIVYPETQIWYWLLPTIAVNRAFHKGKNYVANGWKISPLKYFLTVTGCMFVYFWLPNYMFQTLTYFNWITWISPKNILLSTLCGTYIFNLGITPIGSLDWNWIGSFSALTSPFWVSANLIGSQTVWGILVIIPSYFTNLWESAYLPINSNLLYDNTGRKYNVTRILDSFANLEPSAYHEYSPVYISAAKALQYCACFAAFPGI